MTRGGAMFSSKIEEKGASDRPDAGKKVFKTFTFLQSLPKEGSKGDARRDKPAGQAKMGKKVFGWSCPS